MVRESLEPGCLYHIYNHAVGKDNLFRSDDNYFYFLRRYQHFIDPVADTYVYCLMPNHIHFLIEVKERINLPENCKYTVSQYVSKQFSNLFSSYSQAFNKQQKRMGNLFISNFKRKRIDSDEYQSRLIQYIHLNPVHHGFVKNNRNWKFSSYNIICSDGETFLAREKVLKLFGGVEGFKMYHSKEDQLPKV
jgi:putative transposase